MKLFVNGNFPSNFINNFIILKKINIIDNWRKIFSNPIIPKNTHKLINKKKSHKLEFQYVFFPNSIEKFHHHQQFHNL